MSRAPQPEKRWMPRMLRLAAAVVALGCSAWGRAPDFHLKDTESREHTASEWKGKKAILLFFVTTDCPIANSYVPEMNRISHDYADRGVLVWGIQTDPTIPTAEVARYARDYRYQFPLVLDPQQLLVAYTGATITPQAAVLSPEGKILYLGRIDNRVADFGKQRFQATSFDLRTALDAVLAGKPVAHPITKSIGCAINRLQP